MITTVFRVCVCVNDAVPPGGWNARKKTWRILLGDQEQEEEEEEEDHEQEEIQNERDKSANQARTAIHQNQWGGTGAGQVPARFGS